MKCFKFLNNFSIGGRLLGLTLFLSAALVATGLSGIWGIRQATDALSRIYDVNVSAVNQLQQVRYLQMQIRNLVLEARLAEDAFTAQERFDTIDKHVRVVNETLNTFTQRALNAEETALYERYAVARKKFGEDGLMHIRDLFNAERWAEADRHYRAVMDPAYVQVSDTTDALISHFIQSAERSRAQIDRLSGVLQTSALAIMGIGLALSVVLSLLIRRGIVGCAGGLEQAAGRLAKGDLTSLANAEGRDELARVATAFNRMTREFSGLIGQIRQSAEEVSRSAALTADNSAAVLSVSGRQESLADATVQAAQELTATVAQVGENIATMVAAADQASQLARQGEGVVGQAAEGIQAISGTVSRSAELVSALGRHSDEIGRIVNVIRDIADQTNLLALNAAIEAARAGEQGRGFAVVADEVRKLAERTSKATGEISATIQTIQEETGKAVTAMAQGSQEVHHGVDMAMQAGRAIAEINAAVSHVSSLIHDIDHIRKGQDTASQAIAARMDEILSMARQNRSAAENSAQAAQGLTGLAQRLRDTVSRFTLAN